MCQRCVELQLAINKGCRLVKDGLDAEARGSANAFVETLRAELAALKARPDHPN